MNARLAAYLGIILAGSLHAFAATAATLSIAVVFLPVVFVEGLVGSFLGEFGVTVAAAVMFSLSTSKTTTNASGS